MINLNIKKEFKKKYQFNPGWYFLFHPFYFARRNLNRFFKKHSFNLKGNLLDVGCGSMPYKNLFTKVENYIGLDIERNKKQSSANFFYDGKKFPFKDETFDSVICSQVLEHVFEPDFFLREIHRVIKINGLVILTVPFIWDEHEKPYDYARYTSFGLRYILKKKGFKILKQFKIGNDLTVITQLINCYIYKKLYEKNFFIVKIISLVLFSCFNILGIFLSLLPNNNDTYIDNFIIFKKK